jgi:hypothetical protein
VVTIWPTCFNIKNTAFCIYEFCTILIVNSDYFLKLHYTIDIYIMVKGCVFFEVLAEYLNIT